jgi:hypothetical protein
MTKGPAAINGHGGCNLSACGMAFQGWSAE